MWEEIEFDPEKIPLFKLLAHGLQIIFVFVAWCLEITVFRAEGAAVNGNNGWTFAVVSSHKGCAGKTALLSKTNLHLCSASFRYRRGSFSS